MSTEKPWLDADIGVSAPTKLTPIDWQARCLKAEGDLAQCTERTKEVEKEWDRRFELLIDQRNSSRAELALIKGRQEWGTQSVFGTSARQSGADALQAVAQYPTRLRLVSRYAPGPWVPVKEGE